MEETPEMSLDGTPEGSLTEEEPELLQAKEIFLLMKKEHRLSRNTRAHWYFSNLNSVIRVTNRQCLAEFTGDQDVVSVVPEEPVPPDWDSDTCHLYKYHVSSQTMVTFLSQQYRFVYLLDFSPSSSSVDVMKDAVLLDKMLSGLQRSLEGVIRPFYVPGSQLLFRPDIYVTVIAWTPFLCSGAHKVLHQGWLLTPDNIAGFLAGVSAGLNVIEEQVSQMAAIVIDELETIKLQSENVVGALFEDSSSPMTPSIPMAAPDTGFVNMIYTGMLSLQLLPENSSAGIIVITDGVISIPDINIFDVLLNQLRTKSICLSFLQTSSAYHPHTGLGYNPYPEMMEFMSLATSGSFLPRIPEIEPSEPYVYEMNIYHEAFLSWSFRRILEGVQPKPVIEFEKDLRRKGNNFSEIKNPFFIKFIEEDLIYKKKMDHFVNTNLTSILSCRLREGYTVNTVNQNDHEIKVKLTLPWKYHTFIHYIIWSSWPPNSGPECHKCRVEVAVEGPYDILYDLISQKDIQFQSHYRMSVIRKFYATLQLLTQTDKLLVHLHSFTSNQAHYTIPDTNRSGMPLFSLVPGSGEITLMVQDYPHHVFATFWKPVCSLDMSIWHRWMHTHRIGLLLQHDHPLPKYLLMSCQTGRYYQVLCRKAASKIYDLLKDWSEFILLENHSYIRFIRDNDGMPTSFYVIRVASKPPCLVVWLAFLGGILGSTRHQIVQELTEKIENLTITQRVCWKDIPLTKIKPVDSEDEDDGSSSDAGVKHHNSQYSEVYACVMLSKPVEKILIRYDKMPTDFYSVLGNLGPFPSRSYSPVGFRGPDGQRQSRSAPKSASVAFLTLSRYLCHQRCIWSVQSSTSVIVSTQSVARILNTLCKMRLHEGFSFAHSSNGIQNLVLELPTTGSSEGDGQNCVVQYVIFPPHTTTSSMKDSLSEDDMVEALQDDHEMAEADGEVQIITEFWTEPQSGNVLGCDPNLEFLNNASHKDVAARFFPRDLECISTLITFEHLSLMCTNDAVPSPPPTSCHPDLHQLPRHEVTNSSSRDQSSPRLIPLTSNTTIQIPFAFDLMSLLPKSHQTELLFSLFIQDLNSSVQGVPYAWYPGHSPLGDRPNQLLLEHLFKQLETISDREVHLSSRENKMLPELLRSRRTSQSKFQIPPTSDWRLAEESQPSSLNILPSHPSTLSTKPRDTINAGSFSRRNPSGNSVTSSMTDNYISDNLPCGNRDPVVEPLDHYPKWRCFMKAISTTHLVLTIIPATFHDLKLLTLNEDTLQGLESDVVAVVEKPIDPVHPYRNEMLDGFSIDSSISNLEMMGTDFGDTSSTFSEEPPHSFRQKSGSDAGDRIRPKLPTIRKASGGISAEALMRNRTASDVFPDTKSKSCLKDMNMSREANDRYRCLSMDSKQSTGQQKSSFQSRSKTMSGPHEHLKLKKLSACSTPKSNTKTPPAPSTDNTYGSVTLPIYVYDCNIAGLTNALLFKDRVPKPKNNCQNHLFRHESGMKKQENKHNSNESLKVSGTVDEEAKTPEPEPIHLAHDPQESAVLEKEIKQQCHLLQMTYFKSYVSILFRCLQFNLPVHSYDVEHALNYCDHESSLDLELYNFIQAVCPHNDTITRDNYDKTISKNDSHLSSVETKQVLDTEKIRSASSCAKQSLLHKNIQNKFQEIIQAQFRLVPSHPNVFFFSPPGLWDRPGLDEIDGISSSRRRKETSTSGGTAKNHNSGDSSGNKADYVDFNIEFKIEPSESGHKSQKDDGFSDTEVETAARDGHSNMSVLSNLETESDLDELDEEKDDASPPLFFQLSFSISQSNEDIVSAPVNDLPTCFSAILQSPSIPDPEQDMDLETLGLRLDLVCMTLPVEMGTMPPNIGLRITSLCSSTSYRDSLTMPDNDSVSSLSSIEEDIDSGSDGLAHLPEYQHRAVMNVLTDVKWMLRDEIAFAASKKVPMTGTTLELVTKHVSSSVGKPGALVDSVGLQFVFGIDPSLKEFNEKIKVMQLSGFELKEESGFYYLALKRVESCENDSLSETANDEIIDGKDSEDVFSSSRRSKQRHSRQLQLSPVKETSLSNQASVEVDHLKDTEEKVSLSSAADSSDMSDISDLNAGKGGRDHKQEHVNFISNFDVILQVNKDKVTLFVHFRDNNPTASATWKLVNAEIVENIKNICTAVNQSLLLQDLYSNRLCNWLLEPEANEDWRDPSRQLSNDDSFEAPYLEANLNMNFRPGRFSCPEVWETSFHLHPRLKQGQNPHTHSRGMQALRSVLSAFLVTNRSDMFVYQDDKKNIFYLKLYENQQGRYNLLSRQSSYAQMNDPETLSRSSSIGSSRQLQRTPRQSGSFQRQAGVPIDHEELGSYSRSNSVTESDRKHFSDENTIILKVHGIQEAGPNIKQDLVAVLQKKLDEKVVEVISMMLQRNVRCKLAPEDVVFLQKPMSPPSSVLQFSVHVNAIQYLHAVAFYLRQNMIRIPLIVPNYTPGSTLHFKDYTIINDPSSGESICAEENSSQAVGNDVFLYNGHSAVLATDRQKIVHDSHKGIGCIALSIVDGQGNLVKHFSYPKPVNLEHSSQSQKIDMAEMQELTTTSVYKRDEKEGDKSPGPMALIQFRIWESGRVDLEKITDLLQCAIRHALWDALLEYKMLPVPLTEKSDVVGHVDLGLFCAETVNKSSAQIDGTPTRPVHCKSTKLSLDALGEPASSIKLLSTYSSSSSPINIESSPSLDKRPPLNTPEIVIEATDLMNSPVQNEANGYDHGSQGALNAMYHSGVQEWFEFGLDLGPNGVPSILKHPMKLIAKHSLHIILKEIQQQIGTVIPDLDTRVFQRLQQQDSEDLYVPCSKLPSYSGVENETWQSNPEDDTYIIVGRNIAHWKACTQEDIIQPEKVKTKHMLAYQNFPPLILPILQHGLENNMALSPSVMTLTSSTPNPALAHSFANSSVTSGTPCTLYTTPGTPCTPSIATSGLAGIIGTMNTSSPVFVPRQRLLITMVSKKEIVMYFYNVSRDCQERMVKQTSNLGHWFTARSSLTNSIVMQKMGLFHNQDFYRQESMCNNPFIGNSSYVDSLVKHHAPPNTLDALSKSKQAQIAFREVFRDNKPEKPIYKTKYNAEKDALGKHGKQMLNIWGSEQRDLKNRLYDMWQSRGEPYVYSEDLITYFKQKARLIHYIFTPLLFLPKWRWQAQLTRNHGVEAMDFLPAAENKRNSSVSITGEFLDLSKSRHGSDGSAKLSESRINKTLSAKTSVVSMGNKSPANSPKLQVRTTQTEWFHSELVSHYIQEYIQYLQTLGFMLIEPKSTVPRRRPTGGNDKSHEDVYQKKRHRTGSPRVSYLQKSLPAGLLIFEIGVLEPFFYTKLLAMEEARIQMKISQTVASKNYKVNFIDECDRNKTLIHLHSFTYDYHLRTIHNYIAQKNPANIRKGFHLTSFLDDFMKYYNKSPNYARNLIHAGVVHVPSNTVTPAQMFNYLLSHEKQYRMNVIRMEPVYLDSDMDFDNEYVLTQLSSHNITYNTDNGLPEHRRKDDFDVTLLLSHDICPQDKKLLTLKYFVIMTSKRELYPMKGQWNTLGKFRTVTTQQGVKDFSNASSAPRATPEVISQGRRPSGEESTRESREATPEGVAWEETTLKSHILGKLGGIRQESVNYIGYYSEHEETMKNVIMAQASNAEERVGETVSSAMIDCRRDQLWQKLLLCRGPKDPAAQLSYHEFTELITLVHHETLDKVDPQLLPLLTKSTAWFTALSHTMVTKYGDLCRQFVSSDGKVHHTVVLNESYMDTFALVSVDNSTKEGTLNIVYKENKANNNFMPFVYTLIEGFVESCCFHLYSQLL